jgi:imidazolonepropionase-like amidohydrolase
MELDGWNWEDAAHTRDVAVHMNWPGLQRVKFDFETFTRSSENNPEYQKNVDEINTFFNDAISYAALAAKDVNLKFDAMQGLFNGSKVLIIHATRAKEVIDAVTFAKSKGVKKISVACGDDVLNITEFLKSHQIGVIVPSIHTLPIRDDEAIDLQYSLAALLSKAGVKVAFSHTGSLGTGRNLPFYAGTSVAHGMDPLEALQALTINPARMLGVDTRTGSLEKGKDATLFVSSGDVFDFRTNKISEAFISGKRIVLNNKHEELYDRYSKKYGHRK